MSTCDRHNETIEEYQHRNEIVRFYYAHLGGILAGCGLIFAGLYATAVIRSMQKHRVSRKCYVLLLDRSISDTVASALAFLVAIYVFAWNLAGPVLMAITELFLIGSFWSVMVSYTSLSLLKLFAVAQPLRYRRVITLRRCIYVVIGSWILYLAHIIVLLMVFAQISAGGQFFGCKGDVCVRWINSARNSLIIACYFGTIAAFIGTVTYIHRAQRFVDTFRTASSNNDKVARFSLWKIASFVASFALLYSVQVAQSFFVLFNTDRCIFERNPFLIWQISGVVRTLALVRIVVDPIVSLFVDKQIRRSTIELFECICPVKFCTKVMHKRSITVKTESTNASGPDNGNNGAIDMAHRNNLRP